MIFASLRSFAPLRETRLPEAGTAEQTNKEFRWKKLRESIEKVCAYKPISVISAHQLHQ
jgi:hypothetical protein